jgi:hypothetical protein
VLPVVFGLFESMDRLRVSVEPHPVKSNPKPRAKAGITVFFIRIDFPPLSVSAFVVEAPSF